MPTTHALPGTDHVVAGVRMHAVSYGGGTGLPLLLVHGIGTSASLWSPVQRALGHRHRSVAVDLLGCGASEAPVGGRFDLASQAQTLLHLLDGMELATVGLVAHDVGGGVAAHLIALAPERVSALILTGTPMHIDAWPPPSLRDVAAPVMSLLAKLVGRHHEAQRLDRLARAADPAAVESAYTIVRAQPPPSLVVWGNDDMRLSAAYGRRLAADLAATFVAVMDAGHDLPRTRPERLAEEIEAWVAELDG